MSWVSPPTGSAIQTRRASTSHQSWVPLPYMDKALEHLVTHRSGGLALDPGMRKTSITLGAYTVLKQQQQIDKPMLVIAPLRVCRMVWRQEGSKWTEFKDLVFALLHGPKKDEVLRKSRADIYLINPEGVEWLMAQFPGRKLDCFFSIVCIDELTRFKNHQSKRSKALRPKLGRVIRWGLTGSLVPNGYMDLFGQMLFLDDGAALGKYITHFRDSFFQVDFNGFDYNLQPGAERRIIAKIAPYWMQLSADDYLQLPEIVEDVIQLDLNPADRKTYNTMKRDMLAELPEGVVTAANAAATYSKLAQMANGAVYVGEGQTRKVACIHDMKLDAIEELIEDLGGEPLLIAYEFNHDLDRLRERFGADLPYLGKGTSAANEEKWINAWNRGELRIMAAHPASAGHGLNLQEGNAAHIVWFSAIWDLELWDQFIRRLKRSGNKAQRIFNHILSVLGTIDELKMEALEDKDATQGRMLKALNAEILRDGAKTHATGETVADDRKIPMVQKLSRAGGAPVQQAAPVAVKGWNAAAATPAEQEPAQVQQDAPKAVRGWNTGAAQAEPATQATFGQRERIQQEIAPQAQVPASEQARSMFSQSVTAQREQLEQGQAEEALGGPVQPVAQPATRSRRKAATAAPEPTQTDGIAPEVAANIRLEVLKIAFSDPQTSMEDGMEIAREFAEWVLTGEG